MDQQKNIGQLALAVSNLCKLVGVVMLTYGLSTKYDGVYFWIGVVGGGSSIVLPVLYDVIILGRAVLKGFAIGAESGIKMTLANEALDKNDNVIPLDQAGGSATPPKAVTMEKGLEIVKTYGPAPSEVQKS